MKDNQKMKDKKSELNGMVSETFLNSLKAKDQMLIELIILNAIESIYKYELKKLVQITSKKGLGY